MSSIKMKNNEAREKGRKKNLKQRQTKQRSDLKQTFNVATRPNYTIKQSMFTSYVTK